MHKLLLTLSLISTISACGFTEPKYVEYPEKTKANTTTGNNNTGGGGTNTGGTGTQTCAEEALAVFKASISPPINTVCSTCHGNNGPGSGKITLNNGADSANRDAMFAYGNTDATKINAVLNGGTHSGGEQAKTALPLSTLQSWTTAEAKCL